MSFQNALSSRVRVQTNVLTIGPAGPTIAPGTELGARQVIKELSEVEFFFFIYFFYIFLQSFYFNTKFIILFI